MSIKKSRATSNASNDAGLGLRVPHERPSHGRDLAQVGGHAVPAISHGNQYAALCGAMPADNEFLHDGWTLTMFDSRRFGQTLVCLFASLTVCCDGQGIDHPNSILDAR